MGGNAVRGDEAACCAESPWVGSARAADRFISRKDASDRWAGKNAGNAPMHAASRSLKIFVSSPSDVAEERALAVTVFERLTREYRDTLRLEGVLWEQEPLLAHDSFQAQITSPADCDLFIAVLWSRLGSPLPRDFAGKPGSPPPTGTEFEIEQALAAFRQQGRPAVLVYRKTAPPQANLASSDVEQRLAQYRSLQDFWQRAFHDADGALKSAFHTFGESYEFERKLGEHVRRWIGASLGSSAPVSPHWRDGCPFRGLKVFEREHRDVYFGRARATTDLMRLIRDAEQRGVASRDTPRLLLVQGMSGNGKSSLIRAGVLPLLELRAIEGIRRWYTIVLKPSDSRRGGEVEGIFGAMAERLQAVFPVLCDPPDATETLGARFRAAPEQVAALLEGYVASTAMEAGITSSQMRVVVFLDQLEELFTGVLANDELDRVARCIVSLATNSTFWVIATSRSDMVHKLETCPGLDALVPRIPRYTLAAPRSDEVVQMVREPAQAAGLVWDVRDNLRLDEALLREAESSPEGLPLLEFTLEELYLRREGSKLTFDAYDALGGLRGALVTTAEAIVTAAGADGDKVISHVMRSLVAVDDQGTATRRYAPREEFASSPAVQAMVDQLLQQRLCVSDERGMPVVLLAHEALITSWPRAVAWLGRERELLQARDRVIRDAGLWQSRGRRRSLLSTAPEKIAEIVNLQQAGLPLLREAGEFARASVREGKIVKRWRVTALATICLLGAAAVIAAVIGLTERTRAELAMFRQFEDRAWQALDRDDALLAARYALAGSLASRDYAESIREAMAPRWKLLLAATLNRYSEPSVGPAAPAIPENFTRRVGEGVGKTSADAFWSWWGSEQERRRAAKEPGLRILDVSPNGSMMLAVATVYLINGKRSLGYGNARYLVQNTELALSVWDTRSRSRLPLPPSWEFSGSVVSASFSADNKEVVLVASERFNQLRRPRLLNGRLPDGELRPVAIPLPEDVSHIMLAPDGTRVVACCEASISPQVIEIANPTRVVPIGTPGASVRGLQFSPDSTRVAIVESGGNLTVWDVVLGRQLLAIATGSEETSDASYSPNGRQLATFGGAGAGDSRIWDANTGRELKRLMVPDAIDLASMRYSEDGMRIEGRDDKQRTYAWSALSISEVPLSASACRAELRGMTSRDGKKLLVWGAGSRARLCDVASDMQMALLDGVHAGVVNGASLSGDASLAVTAGADRVAVVWRLANEASAIAKLPHPAPVRAAAFGTDGQHVATGDASGVVRIWNVASAKTVHELIGHPAAVSIVVYSPDGSLILSAADNGKAALWNAASGGLMASATPDSDSEVRAAAFSADGRWFATGGNDHAVRIWTLAGQAVSTLRGHRAPVTSVNFSPRGDLLSSASEDGTVRLWDVTGGREIAAFAVDKVSTAEFLADGHLFTMGRDHRFRLWSTGRLAEGFEQLSAYACDRVLDDRSNKFSLSDRLADRSIPELFLRDRAPERSVCGGDVAPGASAASKAGR